MARTARGSSLLKTPASRIRYTDAEDPSPASGRRSSGFDASDREWILLQATLQSTSQRGASTHQAVRELVDENDETFMNVAQLRERIAEKEAANERKRNEALAEQDKFIWDLSLAIKRCLVEEKGPTTINGVAISHLPVQTLLDMAEADDPEPDTWARWIEGKFCQQIA
jgi:hypothetical protein